MLFTYKKAIQSYLQRNESFANSIMEKTKKSTTHLTEKIIIEFPETF